MSNKKEMPRLKKHYKDNVIPRFLKEHKYENVNSIPKIEKIVLNAGLGDVKDNKKSFEKALEEMATITGQKPVVIGAKKSVSNFNLRQGMKVAAKVTLRGDKMHEFLDRLISIALPRVRDFEGLPTKSFDGKGNYAFGVKEQLIFPEIPYDNIDKVRGFDVIIVTTAKDNEESKLLLKEMGFPFKKENKVEG